VPKKYHPSANGPKPAPHQRINSAPPHGAAYQYKIAAHLVFQLHILRSQLLAEMPSRFTQGMAVEQDNWSTLG
jgi:hypothetical protein